MAPDEVDKQRSAAPIVAGRTRSAVRLALAAVMIGVAGQAFSATVYVKEEFQIGLHSGAERRAPILELVRAGAALEELARNGNFVRVRTDDGVEGWVDAQYISDKPSAATRQLELESVNEALNAELSALRGEVERLKSDLLDSEENRKRQISAISRSADVQAEALRAELERLRVVRAATPTVVTGDVSGGTPESAYANQLNDEIERLNIELSRLRSLEGSAEPARIPSDTLRELERLAEESRNAKEKLAQAQSRASRLAAATRVADAPPPTTALLDQIGAWHWALIGSAALLMFGLGNLWSDFLVRRRHGGYRL